MGEGWLCEAPDCFAEATVVIHSPFGRLDVCAAHEGDALEPASWVWVVLGVPRPRPPRAYTALSVDGEGVIVQGTPRSVLLTLKDAIRAGQRVVHFLTDGGLFGVDTTVEWDLKEVRRAER